MTSTASPARDHALLLDAVETYFQALHTTDVSLLDRVFHPAATLFDVDEGRVTIDPYRDWRHDVKARPDPASAGHPRDDEVIAVQWLSDACATVAVRIRIFSDVFVDHLCLVRDADRFRVVAKVWHLERSI